jgi:hypothetical protein
MFRWKKWLEPQDISGRHIPGMWNHKISVADIFRGCVLLFTSGTCVWDKHICVCFDDIPVSTITTAGRSYHVFFHFGVCFVCTCFRRVRLYVDVSIYVWRCSFGLSHQQLQANTLIPRPRNCWDCPSFPNDIDGPMHRRLPTIVLE